MAVALRATARTAAVASTAGLSAARGGSIRLTVSGLADIGATFLAIGPVVGGPPATYADFTSELGNRLVLAPSAMQVAYDPGASEYTATLTYPIDPGAVTLGQELWVGIFTDGATPPGDAEIPEATSGPIAAVA